MNGLSRDPAGSRFDGRVTATLHGQIRRASPEYVDSRVVIGIDREATARANKGRLALAAPFVDDSTRRTRLRCVGRIDLNKRPAALCQFVGQHGSKDAPCLRPYRPIQAALSFPGRGHIYDFEILQRHGPEAVRDIGRNPMQPISADPGLSGRQLCGPAKLLRAPPRPYLASGENSPASSQPSLQRSADRKGKALAVRKGDRSCYASIDPNRWIDVRSCFAVVLRHENHMPAFSRGFDGGAFNLAQGSARRTKLYPTKSRHSDRRPLTVDWPASEICSLKSKSIVHAFSSRRRVAGAAGEKVCESFIEVAQCLCKADVGHVLYPREFIAEVRHLWTLSYVIEGTALGCPKLPPPVTSLFERQVIDQPRYASELLERGLLLGAGRKFETESTSNHRRKPSRIRADFQTFTPTLEHPDHE